MSERITVDVTCTAKDAFVSAWAKHVNKVDLGKPGGFSLSGDFIGGYKSTIDPRSCFAITRMPDKLNAGEAVVIGATIHHKDNGDMYGKIAFVMTASKKGKTITSPFAPAIDKVKSHAITAKIDAEPGPLEIAMTICGLTPKHLSDYYNGDVFFVASHNSAYAGTQPHIVSYSASPFNQVASFLADNYKVPEADLTQDFEKSRARSVVVDWESNILTERSRKVTRAHIRHDGKKLLLPKGYAVTFEPRKGLALLKRESDGDVAFFDILADDDEFNSNEHWEDYLEQQARALESMAMAYRIIAQMKDKKNKDK